MKTKILLGIIICLPFCMKAQITLTTLLPNSGMLLKDQLWNVVITNNTNDIAALTLQLDVRDVLLGQSVINASSGKIIIGKGMKLVTLKDVQPVIYDYVATEFSGNYLPCGSYIMNYHLVQETSKGDILPVANEVIRINVTPLSPPLLTTPVDKSIIETAYPQFTWMPPAPIQMFNPLLYDITVVAIEEGQSPKEAIEFNKPVYINSNLQNPAEKMPASFGQLQQGKSYAWQVVARSGMNYASPTEVWAFTVKKEIEKTDSSNNSYVLLNNVGDKQGIFNLKGNSLNIKYYSFDKEYTAAIRLMSGDGKILQQANQKILYGDNFINIKLGQNFKKGQLFKIELITVNGNKHSALFSISN
jgi:hypothetical protein